MSTNSNSVIFAALRSDKHKNPEMKPYRFFKLSECKQLGHRVKVLDRFGRVAEVTITSVKTWKTRPDVKIGWKFGLYEYGSELFTKDEDNKFFVEEVEQGKGY